MPRAAHDCGAEWMTLITDPGRIRAATPQTVMPIFQGMMRSGCKACPSAQTRVCQNLEKPLSVLGHDLVARWTAMPWEFKAEDILAGGASDGSVPHELIRAVIRAAEATATALGHDAVSLGDYVVAVTELARDYAYAAPGATDPEFESELAALGSPTETIQRGRAESKERAAAYRADPVATRRNADAIIAALPFEAEVHDALAERELHWCSHVPHLFTRLLSRAAVSEEELADLFGLAEAVARERAHPGVTPRDVQTALMRAAASGLDPARQ
ncbi:MAG: hypothetical protein IT303_19185 [Dehalococcoidia bacterium]|nr:hypothetical protein [Dehalococcoidia bacterium]